MNNSTRPNRPELDATKVPTEIDIAWAAGVYEGEGTCRLCGRTKRGFMASVAQKDTEILYRLREWFGGSITGNGKNFGCHNWNICGDRGRIFMALIYKFMSARRKSQIDFAGALDFLSGTSPVDLNLSQLKSAMADYYAEHNRMVRERVKSARSKAYQDLISTPEGKAKKLAYGARSRANMTPEQIESARQYQKEYYQRKKSKLHIVQSTEVA